MNLGGLEWVLETLGDWLDRLSRRRAALDEQAETAIKAFLAALQETRHFLAGAAGEHTTPDNAPHRRLSDLWLEAARLVRHLDSELAYRCNSKARYWADPVGWAPNDAQEANIMIESMEQAAKRLLFPAEKGQRGEQSLVRVARQEPMARNCKKCGASLVLKRCKSTGRPTPDDRRRWAAFDYVCPSPACCRKHPMVLPEDDWTAEERECMSQPPRS